MSELGVNPPGSAGKGL